MRLPQKMDYALQAAVELGRLGDGVKVPAGEVADRLGLPRRFVEQQVSMLSRAGLVVCQRGPRGGCCLARSASEVSAGDVMRAVEGTLLEAPNPGSSFSSLWEDAAAAFEAVFDNVTLADLSSHIEAGRQSDVYFI